MVAESVTVRRIGVCLAVAAALLTSACAAGQHAATSEEKPTLDGANASVGDINLRGVVVEAPLGNATNYPVGSTAPVRIVVVNNGRTTDQLTSVTSTAFSDWHAVPNNSVKIPPGGRTSWGMPESRGDLLLRQSKQVLYPGTTVKVTFTFAKAGSVTFAVPVELSTSPPQVSIPAVPSSSVPA